MYDRFGEATVTSDHLVLLLNLHLSIHHHRGLNISAVRRIYDAAPPCQSQWTVRVELFPNRVVFEAVPIPSGLSGESVQLRGPTGVSSDRVGLTTLSEPGHHGQEMGRIPRENPAKWKFPSAIMEAGFHFGAPRPRSRRKMSIRRRASGTTMRTLAPRGSALSVPSGEAAQCRWRSTRGVECSAAVGDPYTTSSGSVSKKPPGPAKKTRRNGTLLPRNWNDASIPGLRRPDFATKLSAFRRFSL